MEVYILTRLDIAPDRTNSLVVDAPSARAFLSEEGARRAMREEYDSMRRESDVEYYCDNDEAFIADDDDCGKLWSVKRAEVNP